MMGYKCMIHWRDELRLGPLGLQKVDSENDTTSREHFRVQIQSKQYNQSNTNQGYS